jgi:hypothetical protein
MTKEAAMTEQPAEKPPPENPPPQDQPPEQDDARWTWQFGVAVALLIGFLVLVVVMLFMTGSSTEIVWQRRVYIFGGAEAIVFTAVGWIFGREVNRSAVQTVKQQANDAKKDADAAREETRQHADAAARAEQEAAAERARGDVVASVVEHAQPATVPTPQRGGVAQDAGIGDDGRGQPASQEAGMMVDLPSFLRDVYRR